MDTKAKLLDLGACLSQKGAKMKRRERKVLVAPITHSSPGDVSASLELSADICRALDLDGGRHWLRFDEFNSFVWPGYDLQPRAGKPLRYDYGILAQALFEGLRKGVLDRQRERRSRIVPRD